jgi:hypothetical protein
MHPPVNLKSTVSNTWPYLNARALCTVCRKATDKEEEQYLAQYDAAMRELNALLAEQGEALRAEALREAKELSRYIPGADQEPTYPSPQDARDVGTSM